MKGLREKFRKNEGFTLVEMLIVVAIIAILIAVSIPLVNTSLEKARIAVDQANARDAITLASVEVMTEGITETTKWAYSVDATGHTGTLSNGMTTGEPTGGVKGQSSKLKETPLVVTYTHDENGGTFSTSYDDGLKKATGGGASSSPP